MRSEASGWKPGSDVAEGEAIRYLKLRYQILSFKGSVRKITRTSTPEAAALTARDPGGAHINSSTSVVSTQDARLTEDRDLGRKRARGGARHRTPEGCRHQRDRP